MKTVSKFSNRERRATLSVALIVCTAAIAAMAAAAVPAAAAGPDFATLYHQAELPVSTGAPVAVNVTCPRGYRAMSGSVYPLPGGVTLVKSMSAGNVRQFAFLPSSAGATTVTVTVTCVKIFSIKTIRGKAFKFKILPRQNYSPQTVTLTTGKLIRVVKACPSGTAPTALNFDATGAVGGQSVKYRLRASDVPTAQVAVPVRFIETMPQHGGWSASLWADGDGSASLSLDCLPRTVTARRKNRRAKRDLKILRRLTDTSLPASGENLFLIDCPHRTVPIAPAWQLPDPASLPISPTGFNPFVIFGGGPARKTNQIGIYGLNMWSGGSASLKFGGLCASGTQIRIGADVKF